MDDISPEILINPRLRGVHEQYYRAQWFVQNALVASDLATRFRLLITAIYPARAIVELMLEAAEQQELKPFLDPDSKKSRKSFEETLVPVLPYYHLNELLRSKLRGIKPLNPETVVVRTALARQFGGVDHGVSGGGTLCEP